VTPENGCSIEVAQKCGFGGRGQHGQEPCAFRRQGLAAAGKQNEAGGKNLGDERPARQALSSHQSSVRRRCIAPSLIHKCERFASAQSRIFLLDAK
jgi:hypothetical protein